jgi:glycerol uptake facilitator-like aquaporin
MSEIAPDASLEPPLQPARFSVRLAAEAIGTAWLLATVIGSGIMGERLAGGNTAIALLANSIATGGSLFVLITIFGPISGAHFNPVVSMAFALRREMSWRAAGAYAAVQVVAAVAGVWLAHAMFAAPIIEISTKVRAGPAQALSEAVAEFGLIITILGAVRFRPQATPAAVALYITAAYWFTASTSFANPAVTLARCLSNSFAGIAPASAPAFIIAQLVGALAAVAAGAWLFRAGAASQT